MYPSLPLHLPEFPHAPTMTYLYTVCVCVFSDLICAIVSFLQSAHMPMVDALMMAYTVEMISIEKVVACVKRFSTFSASKELPFDLEDAMVFWINKVWWEHKLSFLRTLLHIVVCQWPTSIMSLRCSENGALKN